MHAPGQTLVTVTPSHSTATSLLVRTAGWLAVAVPILLFTTVWFRYAINIPKWDDHALKAFLVEYRHQTTLTGKVYQVFRQHNEHRIVWDRLITGLDYTLFGRLNYVRLMAVGNLSLVGLLALFGLVLHQEFRGTSRPIRPRANAVSWFLVPIACLLFNLAQWENMFWGMAALQNFTVLFWVAASFYLLAYTDHRMAAFGMGVLATLTSGNGLLVWPITTIILLQQTLTQPVHLRNWRPVLSWGIGAVMVSCLYFLGYEKPAVTPVPSVGIGTLVQGWLAFNGSVADVFPVHLPAFLNYICLGVLIIGLLFYVGIRIVQQHNLSRPLPPIVYFFVGMAGFLIGTSVVVTWSRVGFGFDTLVTSRYKIYSLTWLALLFVYGSATTAGRFRQLVLLTGIAFSSILAWLSYPAYIDDALRLQRWLQASQFNWTYTGNKPVSTIDAQTAQLITNAPAFYDTCLSALFQPATDDAIKPDTLYQTGSRWSLSVKSTPPITAANEGTYLRLQAAKRTLLIAAEPTQNTSRWADLGLTSRFLKGFTATVNRAELPGDLPEGTYRVDILTMSAAGACQLHPTGQRIFLSAATESTVHTNW